MILITFEWRGILQVFDKRSSYSIPNIEANASAILSTLRSNGKMFRLLGTAEQAMYTSAPLLTLLSGRGAPKVMIKHFDASQRGVIK